MTNFHGSIVPVVITLGNGTEYQLNSLEIHITNYSDHFSCIDMFFIHNHEIDEIVDYGMQRENTENFLIFELDFVLSERLFLISRARLTSANYATDESSPMLVTELSWIYPHGNLDENTNVSNRIRRKIIKEQTLDWKKFGF